MERQTCDEALIEGVQGDAVDSGQVSAMLHHRRLSLLLKPDRRSIIG